MSGVRRLFQPAAVGLSSSVLRPPSVSSQQLLPFLTSRFFTNLSLRCGLGAGGAARLLSELCLRDLTALAAAYLTAD